MERMFGELHDLFKDERNLCRLWSDPDTRKALLTRLAEPGYRNFEFYDEVCPAT